jgi:adenylate cyclase
MMSDLRGFTSLSERLSPAEMVDFLNAHLGRMSDIIAEHGGTVIEFIGDPRKSPGRRGGSLPMSIASRS